MQADPRLSGYLSRALSHEMAAVQQYLLQAKLVGMWGMAAQSAKFRTDVSEELTHAERLMERMLILGIPCNGTQLPPARPGRSLEEMLHIDRELEVEAIRALSQMDGSNGVNNTHRRSAHECLACHRSKAARPRTSQKFPRLQSHDGSRCR